MTERQAKLVKLVNQYHKIQVSRLAELLSVSQVTIRKDLDQLEEEGLLTREHGYALMKNSSDINTRLTINYETKMAIAKKACEMVSDGETVMLESGSTCALFAEELAREHKNVTIITNSAYIAIRIRDLPIRKVILLGGEYQKEYQGMVGPLVRKCAREFYVDKFFVGTDGFIPDQGFTCDDLLRVETMQYMSDSANSMIILTDSSKFNKHGVVVQTTFDEVDTIITDDEINDKALGIIKDKGLKVVMVHSEED
ncbi:MAG: DeoR/GlpR family DNA-binding transcription regulator [Lachnospiraceae bacterium]|nr:DeoR/GlpR family DNA-binding transcription regulator [Lachnospiraceae bacterium]